MEDTLDKVVCKLRKLFCFGEYREIMETKPCASLSMSKKGWKIETITFDCYDSIYATPRGVWYSPEHGRSRQLLAFESFEDFLTL